jgi:Ras-related protein Rab-1A
VWKIKKTRREGSMESDCKYLFKIILIGNSGVGKTCLMKRYTDETYNFTQASTIGVDFKIKTVEIEGEKIKLQIWDTAGQERFRAIISNYYRGAHGIIIVFDMGSRDSFDNLGDWLGEVKKHTGQDVEILILGNKCDDRERIVVGEEETSRFLEMNGIETGSYFTTSAKDNINVNASFEYLTKKLHEKYKKIGFTSKKVDLLKLAGDGTSSGSCCA